MATAVNGILPAGERAPSFALPLASGGTFALADPAAKGPTLLVFYKSSCPTCRLTLPFVQRIHEQVSGALCRVAAVSQDGVEAARAFAKDLGLTLPIAVDAEGWPVSAAYDLMAVPTLYLVDRNGLIVSGLAGFNRAGLQKLADELAGSAGLSARSLYLDGEEVPALKPG